MLERIIVYNLATHSREAGAACEEKPRHQDRAAVLPKP
jgi:hypothetical protein